MDHLLKRLKKRLEKCLPSKYSEKKVVPYLQTEDPEENDQNFILRKKSKPKNVNQGDLSFIENLIGTPQTGIASFVTSLNIECSVRQVMRTYYRCHDPSSVAHFAFTEYASHSNYGELLALLRVRLNKADGKPLTVSLPKAFSQLQTCLTEINQGIRENVEIATPLSLGDAAAAILDMVLEIMLTFTHTITLEAVLLTHLADIIHILYLISSSVDLNEEITRVIWCQMTTRFCHMIEASLSQQLKKKHLHDENVNYGFKVQEAARSLQSLHQLVLTLRDTYGLPIAMPPVMAFWATCDVTIQSLSDMMLRGLLKVHTARQLANNVYRFLCATSPSPQELSALVHSPHMKVSTPVQPTLSTNVAATNSSFPESGRSSIISMQSPGGSQLSTQRRAMKSTASSVPIKISFVLVGFQYLVSGATGGDYSNAPGGTISHSLPRQNEWVTCVGEALITSLQPNAAKQLRNLSGLFAELLFLCILVSTPKSVTGVGPNNPKHHSQKHTGIEWLFLELAENTNKYTHSWIKKSHFISRMTQMASSLGNGNKPTGRPPSSMGQATNRSMENGLDTSQRGKRTLRSQSSSNTLESGRRSSNVSSVCEIYNVGDHVDALCPVQNGTQRWFPGVILSRTPFTIAVQSVLSGSLDDNEPPNPFNQFYVYEIQFNDGEIKTQISAADIRQTKNSRSRASSRNTSPRSARQSQGPLSHTNSYVGGTLNTQPMNNILEGSSPQVTASQTSLSLEGDASGTDKSQNRLSPPTHESSFNGSTSSHTPPHSTTGEHSHPHSLLHKSPLPSFKVDLRKSESLGSISLDDRLDMSYDDEEDENIFAIPRVYSRPGSCNENRPVVEDMKQSRYGIMVPRMQLDNLDLTSSIDHGAPSGSLSGSLLREAPKKIITTETSNDLSNAESLSPRGAVDRLLVDYSRDDSSTLTRIESWRDTAGWTTRRSSGVGLPRSSRNANASHASTNSLFSSLHPSNSYQSNVEALKMIHIAVADISLELTIMVELIKTYEIIISILFYYAVSELSENQTAFPSVHRFSFASLYSKSEMSSSPARTNSNASASKMESHISQEISHDFDEFETFPQPEKKEYGNAKQILFTIREFLNSELPGVSNAHIMTCLSYIGPNAIRLLKLSSLLPFENICLPNHLQSHDKISAGSFGSVYRVCCPENCLKSIIPNINQYYAIKRITRERSLHDPAVIFDIYTEITALETMSSFLGVCDLINYGLYEGEYWLILEQGVCDLKEWALQNFSRSKECSLRSASSGPGGGGGGGTSGTSGGIISAAVDQFLLQLYIYSECLSIVKAVHDSEIIHFDIKCNNFILRKMPQLDEMIEAANKHKLSGAIFLADFGESILRSDCDYAAKIKQRARGTLPIQSPEMLCLNNDTQKYKNVRSSKYYPSTLSDIWSLGCLLFEILVGTYLFENKSWTELFCLLCMEKFQQPEVVKMFVELLPQDAIPPIGNISTSVGEIILSILQQNPRDRPQIPDTLGEIHQLILSILPFRSISRRLTDLSPINNVLTRYPNQLQEPQPNHNCTPRSNCSGNSNNNNNNNQTGNNNNSMTKDPTHQFDNDIDNDEMRERESANFSRHSRSQSNSEPPSQSANTTQSENPPADQAFLTSRSNTTTTKQNSNLDLVPAPTGSWIVNSQVSFNVGYVFQQCLESELTAKERTHDSHNHRTIPVYTPIRSNILDSGWRQMLPTSLDEFVSTISSTMSQGSSYCATTISTSSGQLSSNSKYNIERYILRSLHNHCHSSTPSLSYFNMSSMLSCDSQILTANVINQYAITLQSDSQLPSYVSDTSSVSVIRICCVSSKLSLDSSENILQFINKLKFTNGIFCHTFISSTQHLCLIPEQTELNELVEVIFATLKYALDEINQGRSVAICLDPYRAMNTLTTETNPSPIMNSSISSHPPKDPSSSSSAAAAAAASAAAALSNKVYYSKICLTIGIFLACAADAAEEFTDDHDSIPPFHHYYPNLTGSTRGEKLSIILERTFFWIIPFIDLVFFRELCSLANNLHSLDPQNFHSQLFQLG